MTASSAELSIVLAAQRSGSARAASSGPTTLPKPWQADKHLFVVVVYLFMQVLVQLPGPMEFALSV
jgi:hypothetical protein